MTLAPASAGGDRDRAQLPGKLLVRAACAGSHAAFGHRGVERGVRRGASTGGNGRALTTAGFRVAGKSSEDYAALVARERTTWIPVIRRLGLAAQ
jgi:hypothetical protein